MVRQAFSRFSVYIESTYKWRCFLCCMTAEFMPVVLLSYCRITMSDMEHRPLWVRLGAFHNWQRRVGQF